MARISNPKSFAGNKPLATIFDVKELLKGPINAISSNGYVPLESNNKINASYIPQVSITDTFVGNNNDVTSAGDFQTFANNLVNVGKIPAGGTELIRAEKGDLIKITDGEYQGSYVITNVVNNACSYLLLNTSIGTITNVNGQSGPTVTLNLSDINDVSDDLSTLLKTITIETNTTDRIERVLISNKELALLTDLSNKINKVNGAIRGNITVFGTGGQLSDSGVIIGSDNFKSTTIFTTLTVTSTSHNDANGSYLSTENNNIWTYVGSTDTYTAMYNQGNWSVVGTNFGIISDAIINAISQTTYDSNILATESGVHKLLKSESDRALYVENQIVDNLTTEINNRVAVVGELQTQISNNKTAVEKSIEIITYTFTWNETDANISNNIKHYEKNIPGRAIQIFDANGEWCYPNVLYNNESNNSTISVDVETTDVLSEMWTICIANKIIV